MQSNEKTGNLFLQKIQSFLIKYYWVWFCVLVSIITILAFYNLKNNEIYDWDEARHGVNAYEMIRHKNYIANYYSDSYDYWNLKPPISYWAIIIGYKIFGYNTFGLRFFSALAFVGTSIALALFSKNHIGKTASLVVLVVVTSCNKLLWSHCVRTGDPDSIFLFFYCLSIIFLINSKKNVKYLYGCGVCFSLAFLTKSWHAFTIIPIVFVWFIYKGFFKKLKWWQILLFFFYSVILILIWVLLRYSVDNTKFLSKMIRYDLINRSKNGAENNVQPFYYYFTYYLLSINTFSICFYFCTCCLVAQIIKKQKPSELTIIAYVSFVVIFGIFSLSKGKLYWYIYPIVISFILLFSENFCKYLTCCGKVYLNIIKIFGYVIFTGLVAYCSMFSFWYILKSVPKGEDIPIIVREYSLNKQVKIYYQDDIRSDFSQSLVLYFELHYDSYCKGGGYEAFLNDEGAYIILNDAWYQLVKDDVTVIKKYSNNYYLCEK